MRAKFLLLAVLALVLTGCQQVAEKAVEQATGIKVDEKSGSVTIKGKDGEVVTFGTDMPDELKDFPVPQGFEAEQDGFGAMSAKEGEQIAAATWKGKASIESVAEFYEQSMAEKGWKEGTLFTTGDGFQGSYTKGDAEVVVTVSNEKEETTISVLFGKGTKKTTSAAGVSGTSGGSSSSDSRPTNTPAASSSKPTATPKPKPTPTPAGPQLGDASAVPQEMKSIPVPNGFSVVKGSTNRFAEGGTFKAGTVSYFGKADVEDVAEFYAESMADDWDSEAEMVAENEAMFEFVSKTDETLRLGIVVGGESTGTEIVMMLTKE